MEAIRETTLRELIQASSVEGARVIGQKGGYSIAVRYGIAERLLATSRGEVRLFTLDNAGKFLRQIGLPRFEVDTTTYLPGRLRKPRPDRAEALRRTRTRPRQQELV